MKFRTLLLCILLSEPAIAGSDATVVPQNQQLVSVEYSSNGRQTGCGLRATGEAKGGLNLNVLITVFGKETGATFGVFKVVARKELKKSGKPELSDGKIEFEELGTIQHAWITSDSGKRPLVYKDAETSHSDAYLVNTEFASTLEFMAAMLQENFNVGLNRKEGEPDEIYRFSKSLSQAEGSKFSNCIGNLKAVLDEKKRDDSF
jgi:hypothetical protein